ncbi:MAG: DnaA/Hda family protein, partial [Clostridia bacterium]
MNYNDAIKTIHMRRYNALEQVEIIKNFLNTDKQFNKIDRDILNFTISAAQGDFNALKKRDELYLQLDALLHNYGLSRSDLSPNFYCKNCNDTGLFNGKRCKCLLELTNEAEKEINTNMDFTKSLPNINENFIAYCKKYANQSAECLNNIFILGACGTGKTFALYATAAQLRKNNCSVMLTTAFELNQTFLQIYLSEPSTSLKMWNKLTEIEYLLIDDLGTEQIRQNVTIPSFYNLYNQRELYKKHTITTTNLLTDELLKRYGERIFSRLTNISNTKL